VTACSHKMQMITVCMFTLLFLVFLLGIIINPIMNRQRELIMRCSKQEWGRLTYLRYDQSMEWFLTEPEGLII
jgi:hypothetical protein